jgi:hypothetical protein
MIEVSPLLLGWSLRFTCAIITTQAEGGSEGMLQVGPGQYRSAKNAAECWEDWGH